MRAHLADNNGFRVFGSAGATHLPYAKRQARCAAAEYSVDFVYHSRPHYQTYATARIYIQSFIWVQGSDEYE
jgi:hypothetical protein